MKKIIIVFISIMVMIFMFVLYMVWNNDRYYNKIEKNILDKSGIEDIEYVNKYGEYYIVYDKEYLYLINLDYKIISSIDINLIHENKNNYDIIYRDGNFMYMEDIDSDEGLVYRYYDIYSYEIIDKILVGGSNG